MSATSVFDCDDLRKEIFTYCLRVWPFSTLLTIVATCAAGARLDGACRSLNTVRYTQLTRRFVAGTSTLTALIVEFFNLGIYLFCLEGGVHARRFHGRGRERHWRHAREIDETLFHPAPPPGELEEPAASAADVSSQQPEAPGWFLFA